MKTTLTQDSTSDQRIGALPSQKNPRRKENGSSAENSTARTVKGQQTEEVVNFQSFAEMYDNTLTSTTNGTTDLRKLEEENKKKQEKIDSLLIEIEEFKAQLGKIQEDEKTHTQKMKSKHSKLVLDLEDLKSQLEKTQAREKRQLSDLEQEKQNILLQLETTKSELEKFKKRRVLTLTELRKEKDTCLAEIEELKACTEKMREENSLLQERVNVFEQDLDKRAPCPCLPSHAYTVPASTEMLLISHQVSQQSSFSIGTGCRNCWCSTYGGTMQDFSAPKCAETKGPLEEETTRFKDMYKQLKRERNLLLDVMVIMYTRRWFVEEAVPHVKRALRKCGVASEEAD